jgi:hypothetical protein
MLLLTCYYPDSLALAYVLGVVSAFVASLLFDWIMDKRAELNEFRKYKKCKGSAIEVIDVPFVTKPHTQLNNSQALVKRSTSVERRPR